ncbi:MAG: OsmC family protein, partial [Desulfuromonadales bacterium]
SGSHLIMTAKIPDVEDAKFKQIADKAKQGCPISKLLVTKITLDASLEE